MPMVSEPIEVIQREDENGNIIKPDVPKVYLCLLTMQSEDRIWESFVGNKNGMPSPEGKAYYIDPNDDSLKSTREETFLYLESLLSELNLNESFVMTQNQTMKTNVTVYSFMRMCIESDKVISETAITTVDDLNEMCESAGINYEELWAKEMEG